MENLISVVVALLLVGFFVAHYRNSRKREAAKAMEAVEKGKLFSEGPRAQHPHIDSNKCIGCGTCTSVCPEGDVLGMLAGKAAIVKGYKCIGHSLCAEACPVGAITMVMATPSMGVDMPYLTADHETNLTNLFVIGELGGLALIKNAVNQGRNCVDTIAGRLPSLAAKSDAGVLDMVIVGAGPAGISASLRAIERKLNYVTLEQDEIGGAVAKYPRQKLVMTSPVEFPMYGKFNKMELSKENLLTFWEQVMQRADFKARTGERVNSVEQGEDRVFTVVSSKNTYRSRSVVLALGRTGSPRKLGAVGEELSKVMYRLIEADHYINKRILIVGGGDSAIEAALGLASQTGNKVTLSYRQGAFTRIKERNEQRISSAMRSGKVQVLFNSNVHEIRPQSVIISVNGQSREIENDYVWIFAGGVPPYELLKKAGVRFGEADISADVAKEALEAAKAVLAAARGTT